MPNSTATKPEPQYRPGDRVHLVASNELGEVLAVAYKGAVLVEFVSLDVYLRWCQRDEIAPGWNIDGFFRDNG